MILPTKHLPLEASLLGIGAAILDSLGEPREVEALWRSVRGREGIGSFDRFLSALVFLHSLGLVDLDRDGLLRRASR
jgi:hypothetical protein